jgi:cell division septation protein DedD
VADYHDTDDGFHEIQLSGKQLVFLFMATTVVSVVIFLCGVFVGRGVQAQQPLEQVSAAPAPPSTVTASVPLADSGLDALEPPAPPAEAAELNYRQRLEGDPPRESFEAPSPAPRPVAAEPAAPAARAATRAERTAPEPPVTRSAARTTGGESAPARAGAAVDQANSWVVQVHALRDRNAANVIVKRLVAKGYPAFLSSAGSAGIYRVQVGRFTDRQEAERTRERLKNEEKYDPWITH